MQKLEQRVKHVLAQKQMAHTYNQIKVLAGKNEAYVEINNETYLNMCSNNYLGFAADAKAILAAQKGLSEYGVGSGAVRSISGSQAIHLAAEAALARFKGVEATILLQSGFQANTSLLPAIVQKDQDVIISDALNHASIIDAIRLTGIAREQKFIYPHKDMQALADCLAQAQAIVAKTHGIIYVITDGVFSMDGDYAPLDQIAQLCEKYEAIPIVDDAHGEGVFGAHGKGLVDHFQLSGKFIEVGTLSKAFGTAGGFIGGSQALIDYLKQTARPFLFSTGIDPALAAATLHNIKELETDDSRVKKLWSNAKYLQAALHKLNISTGESQSPITPVMVGEEQKATQLTKLLFEDGVLVSPIIFPTVPKGKARIRLMPSALHNEADLDQVVKLIAKHLQTLKK